MSQEEDTRLTIKQIARELDFDERTVRRWIIDKELKASFDLRGRYRVERADLDDFIKRRTEKK